ncbi:MAG: tetratricopeptide repeat protein, partial [Xanthomonadales bacterium]|nr:tetratricopeptide repeat protein [Xanthomonadales bacterium]
RNLDDIFKVQDEIARSVVDTLKVKLLGDPVSQRATPRNTQAYDLYLRGQYFYRQLGEDRLVRAREFYNRALELDPDMALACYGLSGVYINEILSGVRTTEQGLPLAMESLNQALELDPNLANAHYTLGFVRMVFDWDFKGAEDAFRRAQQIEPNSAPAYSGLGLLMSIHGQTTEAIEYQRRSLEIDPLRGPSLHNLGVVAYFGGDYQLAEETFRDVLRLTEDYARGYYYISVSVMLQQRLEEALAEIAKEPADHYRLAGMALTSHALGREEESSAAIRELSDKHGDKAAFLIAEAHAYRGEHSLALQWLDRAVDQHEPVVPWIRNSPFLVDLHADPGFSDLLRRIGLEDN